MGWGGGGLFFPAFVTARNYRIEKKVICLLFGSWRDLLILVSYPLVTTVINLISVSVQSHKKTDATPLADKNLFAGPLPVSAILLYPQD